MKKILEIAELVYSSSALFGGYSTSKDLVEELNPDFAEEKKQLEKCTIIIQTCQKDKQELRKDFINFNSDMKKACKKVFELKNV